MNKHAVHHSSKTNEWHTPQNIFNALDAEFSFQLDAAATSENAKCEKYFSKQNSALGQEWGKKAVWLNPPHSRDLLSAFIAKAAQSAREGATVVMLIPNRPNAAWFEHIYEQIDRKNPCSRVAIRSCVEVRPLKSRVRFHNPEEPETTAGAPFPSAVVIFYPPNQE